MIPWQATSHGRIEVRPAYGTIPVAPGRHIIGWEVRVWHAMKPALGRCNVCGKAPGTRQQKVETAERRPDFDFLDRRGDPDYAWVPYAHECSSPVPWAARSEWPSEGWQHPHHHPIDRDEKGRYDVFAYPILYANAQLAYAAGLELLGIDAPERMHWKPAA